MLVNASSSHWSQEEVENFLSQLSEASFRKRTSVVVYLSLVSIVGFMGNTLVLLVYGLRFKPSATRVFVLFMASLDLVTNVLGLPLQVWTIRHAYNDNYWRCRSFFAFATLSTQASGLLLVVVALDRFWRICAPLRKNLNSQRAFRVALGTVCAGVVVFAPFVPFYGIHRINSTEPGVQARMCWSEDEYKHTFYSIAYKILVGVIFFLGLAIMAVSYGLIGLKLWRKKVERKRSLKSMQRQASQTLPSGVAGPGTDAGVNKENPNGQQNPRTGQAAARIHLDVVAVMHQDLSETDYSESVSTEGYLCQSSYFDTRTTNASGAPNATSLHPGGSTVPTPGTSEANTGTGDEPECGDVSKLEECQAGDKGRPKAEGQPCSSAALKRNTEGAPKKACRRSTVHKCMRRMRSRTTLMMAVLTAFYIVNWLPHLAMRTVRSDPVNWCDNFTDCGYNTYAIVIRSYYLNSAVNAFVYSFCNQLFRQNCREFFQKIVRKRLTRT